MTKEELLHKLAELEWEDFEVKEAKANVPKGCWETVSSFSNTNGGWLIFGVKENGKAFEITGVGNPEKLELDFLNVLRSEKFNVFVATRQYKYNFDGKIVLAFYIPASSKKPVYYNNQSNTYIRRGSGDQKASKEEIDAMYRDQTFGTKTSEMVPNTSIQDVHEKSLKQYRDYMARFNPDVSYNRYDQDEFLQKLRILDETQLTYGGLLFLGNRQSIEKHFPDFRIDLLEIPGTSYEDAKVRYTFRLDEYENLWEYYFECFARLKNKVDVEFHVTNQGFGQELSPGLQSIREALVNMLMHADYFSPAHSRIRIFNDHIEFFNPGGLPKPLEELKGKDISLPRNPIISKLFRMVKMAENAGFGFDKIESNWKEYNNTAPVYDLAFDSTILKLYMKAPPSEVMATDKAPWGNWEEYKNHLSIAVDKDPAEATELFTYAYGLFTGYLRDKYGLNIKDICDTYGLRATEMMMLIEAKANITKKEMAAAIGVSESTIEKELKKMTEGKLIKREGSRKTGHWQIASTSTN